MSYAAKAKLSGVRQYSVTIQNDGQDLDTKQALPIVGEWSMIHCVAGLFGVKRGGSCGHLHLQGVIEIKEATSAANVSKMLNNIDH